MSLEATQPSSGTRVVAESLREYGRGVAGGIIFSLPLLYTMEVWWAGFNLRPPYLILYVSATFVLLLGYNRYVGLRRDASMTEVVIDSIEEMGLGLVLSALVLWLIGRLTSDMPVNEIVSKIVIEAMTVAIGVSVGTAQLGGKNQDDERVTDDLQKQDGKAESESAEENSDKGGDNAGGESQNKVGFGGQIVIAACGAVLFAANVAPTEEIVMIAAENSSHRLLALALFSLVLSALILYFSEFRGSRQFVRVGNPVAIIGGTMMTYAIALVVAALILLFFGRFDGEALNMCVAQTIVLGVAAALGASAGRLLLQQ